MSMNFHTLLALSAAVLLATSALAGQTNPAAKPATPAAKPAAPAPAAPAAPAALAKPIRGEAPVSMTKPVVKRVSGEVVTTFKVKNPSATLAIAGLKISEFWYDKGGTVIMSDDYRHRGAVLPNQIIDVELRVPSSPQLASASSQYKFEQVNGAVRPKVVPKVE